MAYSINLLKVSHVTQLFNIYYVFTMFLKLNILCLSGNNIYFCVYGVQLQ